MRHSRTSLAGALVTLAAAIGAGAAEEDAAAPPLELIPIPDGAPGPGAGDTLEPSVRVRPGVKSDTWEYRAGGRVIGMWVRPPHGTPYLLSDQDGDGVLESKDPLREPPTTAKWRVFSW